MAASIRWRSSDVGDLEAGRNFVDRCIQGGPLHAVMTTAQGAIGCSNLMGFDTLFISGPAVALHGVMLLTLTVYAVDIKLPASMLMNS